MKSPPRKISCVEYQIIAEQVPDIDDMDRQDAIRHISGNTPCHDCIDRQNAFKAIQSREL